MRKFIVGGGNNPTVVRKALADRGGWEEGYAKLDELGSDSRLIFNHFEDNRNLCTKTGLIRSLRQYYLMNDQANSARYTAWETTPTTFILSAGVENSEYTGFVTRFRDISKGFFQKEHLPEKHCQENIWLIKPANLNQGRGIEIFKNLEKILTFLGQQPPNSYWVAQKYIEKPLLYFGRKFDIRIWALVTCKNEVFIYKHGYMRTSSDDYSLNNPNNYVHLTNNCLQKHGDNYGKHEDGNTLSLDALQKYFDQAFPNLGLSVEKHFMPRMKDFIIDTFLSVKKSLNPKKRKNCFELFGYDFIIDEDFRTWLLEVNTNPYFGYANEFAKNLLTKMADDMFAIVLDPTYPPVNEIKREENGFELLYCEQGSVHHNGPLNVRSGYIENIYPIPSLAPQTKPHRQFGIYSLVEKLGGNKGTENDGLQTQKPHGIRELSEVSAKKSKSKNKNKSKSKRLKSVSSASTSTTPSNNKLALTKGTYSNSGDEKEVSAGNVPTNDANNACVTNNNEGNSQGQNQKNKIDNISKIVKNMIEGVSTLTLEQANIPVYRIFSQLSNWELLSNKDIKTACKALKILSESKLKGLLTTQPIVTQMINILYSQDMPIDIQITTINAISTLLQHHSQMKKVICDRIIHALINIALASCDESKSQDYDPALMMQVISCLCSFAGKYNRKNYIPGETRDLDKVRSFFITQGGLMALFAITRKAVNEEFQKIPKLNCFQHLDIVDWEFQKTVCLKIKEDLALLDKDSSLILQGRISQKTSTALQFLFESESPTPRLSQNKEIVGGGVLKEMESVYVCKADSAIQLPESLFNVKNYPLSELIDDIEDKVAKQKEWILKREKEEGEKKEQLQIDQLKAEEERKKAAMEKRKKAEDEFLKRIEEKKRAQEELIRKNNEEARQRAQEDDERRRQKLEDLIRKREEMRKIQIQEYKKKKLEEELQKKQEEELKEIRKKETLKSFEEWERNKILQRKKNRENEVERSKEPLERRLVEQRTDSNPELKVSNGPRHKTMFVRKLNEPSTDRANDPLKARAATNTHAGLSEQNLKLNNTGNFFQKSSDDGDENVEIKRPSASAKIKSRDDKFKQKDSKPLHLPPIGAHQKKKPDTKTDENDRVLDPIEEASDFKEQLDHTEPGANTKTAQGMKGASVSPYRNKSAKKNKNLIYFQLKEKDEYLLNVYGVKQALGFETTKKKKNKVENKLEGMLEGELNLKEQKGNTPEVLIMRAENTPPLTSTSNQANKGENHHSSKIIKNKILFTPFK